MILKIELQAENYYSAIITCLDFEEQKVFAKTTADPYSDV